MPYLPILLAHPDELVDRVKHHVRYTLVKDWDTVSHADLWHAFSLAAREQLVDPLLLTERRYAATGAKRVAYLSIEFLLGRTLGSALVNLGLLEPWRAAFERLGLTLDQIESHDPEPAVGNGGLGRLAACFLDSLATMGYPAYGYGINYEFGLFRQELDHGWQRERPDHWRPETYPWLISRTEESCLVPLYGRLEDAYDSHGHYAPRWVDQQIILGVPADIPVVGYGVRTVNTLRLYTARSSDEFDMGIFNSGDYIKAVERKVVSETISKVLYPSDSVEHGRELRLIQEYFLVACALRDLMRRHHATFGHFNNLADKLAIQMNDTHPALAVAELMRILVDEQHLTWERAWEITHDVAATPTIHCCQKRSKSGRSAARAACFRGTCRSSSRSTSGWWTGETPLARRRGPRLTDVDHQRGPRQTRTDGQSRCGRQPQGERRRSHPQSARPLEPLP